jgi:hypothetical protein
MDVVLCLDTTRSMAPALWALRRGLDDLAPALFAPGVRVAFLAVGDYDTAGAYVVRPLDFVALDTPLRGFLAALAPVANVWNDGEAYEQALRAARALSWRADARKELIFIGDDRPHPPSFGANTDAVDWRHEVAALAAMGVTMHAVQAPGPDEAAPFFSRLAAAGHHVRLHQLCDVVPVVVALLQRHDAAALEALERRTGGRCMELAVNTLLARADAGRARLPDHLADAAADPGRFQRVPVDDTAALKDVVVRAAIHAARLFVAADAPTTMSGAKGLVVEDLRSGEMFCDNAARLWLGLPVGRMATLDPAGVPAGTRVYLQCKSLTRRVRGGTAVVYEPAPEPGVNRAR